MIFFFYVVDNLPIIQMLALHELTSIPILFLINLFYIIYLLSH
jgi:hypothetical protein